MMTVRYETCKKTHAVVVTRLSWIRHTHNPLVVITQAIYEATKGWGANAQKVIDSLASKDGEQRWKLCKRYEELFNQKLSDLMKKEFSGDFGLAMQFLAMVHLDLDHLQ